MATQSYTTVLDGVPTTTVLLGTKEPVSTTYSSVVSDPTASFVLADLGHGMQIKTLRGNNREWHFAPAPLVAYRFWDPSVPTEDFRQPGFYVSPSLFTSESVVQDATSFTITWTSAIYGTITATGSYNAYDALVLNSTWTPPGLLLGLFSIVCREWQIKPKPQVTDTPTDLGYLSPARTPYYVLEACDSGKSDVTMHPGAYDVEPAFTPETPFNAAYQAPMFYDVDKQAVLMFRTKDTAGRLKEYRMSGGTTCSAFLCRQYNHDIYTVPTVYSAFASDYETWLWVGSGDTETAAVELRGWMEDESWFTRAKILDDDANAIPAHIKSADLVWYMSPVGTSSARASAELARVISDMATYPLVYHYQWYDHEVHQNLPDWYPPRANELNFGITVNDSGCKRILYTWYHVVGMNSTWVNTSGSEPSNHDATKGAPLDMVCLERDQTAYTITPESIPPNTTTGDNIHGFMDFGYSSGGSDMVSSAVEHMRSILDEDSNVDGFFLDTLAGIFVPTSKTALGTNEKGPGSARYTTGLKDFITSLQTACGSTFSLVGEVMSDLYVNHLHLTDTWAYNSAYTYNYSAHNSILFSAYQPMMSFAIYWYDNLSGSASRGFAYNFARLLHRGSMLGFAVGQNGWDSAPFYALPRAGDDNYDAYMAVNGFWITFAKACVAARAANRETFHSYLEPSPVGTYETTIATDGIVSSVVSGRLTFADSEVQVSVHTVAGGANEGEMRLVVSNGGESDATVRVVLTASRYPSLIGKRKLKSGSTVVAEFKGFLDVTLNVDATSVDVYRITET